MADHLGVELYCTPEYVCLPKEGKRVSEWRVLEGQSQQQGD